MMQKLIATSPNAEVFGESVLGYVTCVSREDIKPVLVKYGLDALDVKAWYSHQRMLDVLGDIQNGQTNVAESLVSIGMKVMELVSLPPTINSVPTVLASLSDV